MANQDKMRREQMRLRSLPKPTDNTYTLLAYELEGGEVRVVQRLKRDGTIAKEQTIPLALFSALLTNLREHDDDWGGCIFTDLNDKSTNFAEIVEGFIRNHHVVPRPSSMPRLI